MSFVEDAISLLEISRARGIVRRYFVVNGFDGALTMLGLIIGFMASRTVDLAIVINACLGAAIALGVSGVSSAYVSESAERRRALDALEKTMLTDLQPSTHGIAARWVPLIIAATNGAAPVCVALIIIAPLWATDAGVPLPAAPLATAAGVALLIVFLFGAYLGNIAGTSWIYSGLRTLAIAAITAGLIYLFVHA